jgi:iron complex outermembrane recepter protein
MSPTRYRLPSFAAALAVGLFAADSVAATLQGTVLNQNTRHYLERATVQLQGTSFQTLTDKDGSFRIAGVPAGSYTVVVDYAGLSQATKTVVVSEGAPANITFELTSDVYKMGELVVNSTVEGTAYAINQQRRAESLRSIASMDAFIDQSTGNPGEFLRNISGIQMDYSQNEPNRIRLRGMAPELTTVTMDGNEIASAASSGTNRQLEIDQLSMAAISSVEVFKAPIPSMSANAIGGLVNFTTKSAFEQQGRRVSVQAGVMLDSHDFGGKSVGPGHNDSGAERRIYPVGRFEYSNAFFDNRLGVVFSVGRDHTFMLGSSTTQGINVLAPAGGALPPLPTPFTTENTVVRRGQLAFAPNRQLRTRSDVSLNTDFRLNEATTLFLKSTVSLYHSSNRAHLWFLTPVDSAYTADSTLESYTTTNGTAMHNASVFDKHTTSWQIAPGLKFKSGPWKVELAGGLSKSTNHYENPNNFNTVSLTTVSNLGWTISTPIDDEKPSAITQRSGPDIYDLNHYFPSQGNLATEGQRSNHAGFVSNNVRHSSEVRWSGRLDAQRDFQARFPFYLKAGISYNETIRDKRQPQRRWYWLGEDGVPNTADDTTAAGARMGRFAEPVPVSQQIPNYHLREPVYPSMVEIFEHWQTNPQVLVENLAYAEEQKFLGRRKVNEAIRAAYVMGSATFDKLNLLGGVRLEETEIVAVGSRQLPTSGPNSVVPPGVNANSLEGVRAKYQFITARSDYTSDPFPYLHAKYDWLPDLVTRASYTESIGRPNFAQVLPSMTQDDTPVGGFAGTVTLTRVGLLPQRSKNLDFSVEYFTKSAGVWEASWFSRDIDDYISSATVPMTPALLSELSLGNEFSNYRVSTSTNLGNATWRGYEIGVRQQLRDWKFVPNFLRGIEVWANHTRVYEMEGSFGGGASGPKITYLASVVDKLYNAGISYRSPRGTFYVHLKTNVQGRRPSQNLPPASVAAQRVPRQEKYQFWDMEATYRLTGNLRLIGTARNLFSERQRTTELGVVTSRQQDTGISWMFAAKYDL